MTDRHIDINVPVLARVEGEGALDLRIEGDAITGLQLRIYEPPRYFEKFLEGRSYRDVPDTVARICGICPVAYQMSAVHAIESVFSTGITPWVRNMRRLLYCGEWLQSHSLHIHMLAAPDFLGYNSIIEMSADYPGEARRGLKLQGLGNDIIRLFGGRSVHPVGVRAGGFHRAPRRRDIDELRERFCQSRQEVVDLLHWTATLDLPGDIQDFTSVSLRHPDEYAMNEGRLVSDHGLDIAITDFDEHFQERHVPHSTALHCLLHGKPYLVGPLARLNNNYDRLPAETRALLEQTGISFPSKNMFHSIVARAAEIHFALNEAIRLMDEYEEPDCSYSEVTTTAGVGFGCTEAPRGVLWHRYELDERGDIVSSRIVPPTSQNQARIEEDIEKSLNHFGLENSNDDLRLHAEKVIRNYDPCISCATHFLALTVDRQAGQPVEPWVHVPVPAGAGRTTTLIATGSPAEPDNLAWIMADRLQAMIASQAQTGELEIVKLDRPGTELLRYIEQARREGHRVVIMDTVVDASGDIMVLSAGELSRDTGRLSSHATGVGEALALAQHLNLDLPDCILAIPVAAVGSMPTASRLEHNLREIRNILFGQF